MLFKNLQEIEKVNEAIKLTPEYKLGKKLLDGDISKISIQDAIDGMDGEPTTADEHNKEVHPDYGPAYSMANNSGNKKEWIYAIIICSD